MLFWENVFCLPSIIPLGVCLLVYLCIFFPIIRINNLQSFYRFKILIESSYNTVPIFINKFFIFNVMKNRAMAFKEKQMFCVYAFAYYSVIGNNHHSTSFCFN